MKIKKIESEVNRKVFLLTTNQQKIGNGRKMKDEQAIEENFQLQYET